MDGVVPAPAEQQMLVVSSVRRQRIDQKMVDDGVVAQPLQKAPCEVFLAHFNGDDDVALVQVLDAVGDVGVQQADVAGRHLDPAAVDDLGAAPRIDIEKLDDGMDVLRDKGETGFLVYADASSFHQGVEGEQVHIPSDKVHLRDPPVAGGENVGRFAAMAQFRLGVTEKE